MSAIETGFHGHIEFQGKERGIRFTDIKGKKPTEVSVFDKETDELVTKFTRRTIHEYGISRKKGASQIWDSPLATIGMDTPTAQGFKRDFSAWYQPDMKVTTSQPIAELTPLNSSTFPTAA